MSQKQRIIVILGVVAVVALMVVVYRQLGTSPSRMSAEPMLRSGSQAIVPSRGTEGAASPVSPSKTAPVSTDDIVKDIEKDAVSDSTVLNAEEEGELSDIESDSQSVNDLGKAYDENSF